MEIYPLLLRNRVPKGTLDYSNRNFIDEEEEGTLLKKTKTKK